MEHACPLPTELTKRIVQLTTKKDGVVCDPFAGTGASVVAAQALGRKWIALDINHRYREMFYKRLAEECSGSMIQSTVSTSLRNTNLNLRQLKYPVLLYKRISPGLRLTVGDVPLLAVRKGTLLKKPEPGWVKDGEIVIVVSDNLTTKTLQALTEAVNEIQKIPPLSKFQIEVEVRIVRKCDFANLTLFPQRKQLSLYTRGHFWSASREMRADEIVGTLNRSKFPMLISDIHVDEQPAY